VTELARHRIQVRGNTVTAVRERIERRLGVETEVRVELSVPGKIELFVPSENWWGVYFDAPADVNLDFLRPDVLPPIEEACLPNANNHAIVGRVDPSRPLCQGVGT